MTKHTKTTMSDTLRTKSFMQSLMGYCTSFDLFCERVEWFASTLEAENAELLERLQERTQSHIHASQRDVQTIQQQAIEIDAMREVMKKAQPVVSAYLGFCSDQMSNAQVASLSETLAKIQAFIKP